MYSPDTLTLLLPILWAIIATVIGLVLYRTSKAFFSSDANGKKIRLVGSVVIAALAFLGMKQATPSSRLKSSYQNEINEIYILSTEIDRQALELDGCLTAQDSQHCLDMTRTLRNKTSNLSNKLKDITSKFEDSNTSSK